MLMRRWRVLSGLHWCRICRPDRRSRRIRQVVKPAQTPSQYPTQTDTHRRQTKLNVFALHQISSVVLIRAPEQPSG